LPLFYISQLLKLTDSEKRLLRKLFEIF